MIIEVSEERLAELRALSAVQLALTLTEKQLRRCELEDFSADGTRIVVLPKPAISQDGAAVRAALRNVHKYAPLSSAPAAALERAERKFPKREFEAVRQRLVVHSRDNWLSLYPSITWSGSDAEPAVWHCGDEPRPTKVRGVEHPCIAGLGGYAKCRRSIPGYYSFCFPAPELERRIDTGAAAVRELLMLANCYAP